MFSEGIGKWNMGTRNIGKCRRGVCVCACENENVDQVSNCMQCDCFSFSDRFRALRKRQIVEGVFAKDLDVVPANRWDPTANRKTIRANVSHQEVKPKILSTYHQSTNSLATCSTDCSTTVLRLFYWLFYDCSTECLPSNGGCRILAKTTDGFGRLLIVRDCNLQAFFLAWF